MLSTDQIAWSIFAYTFLGLWPYWVIVGIASCAPLLFKLALRWYEDLRLARAGISAIDSMDGQTFEKYLAVFFRTQGYRVTRTRYIGDFGADLVLQRDGSRTVVQAKRSSGKVGIRAVQEAVAAMGYYRCIHAIVVTNSRYTRQAVELARANGVELWDRSKLIRAILAARRGQPAMPQASASSAPVPLAQVPPHGMAVSPPREHAVCAVCGKPVSDRVRWYCTVHRQRFGGQIYCYEHQRTR